MVAKIDQTEFAEAVEDFADATAHMADILAPGVEGKCRLLIEAGLARLARALIAETLLTIKRFPGGDT